MAITTSILTGGTNSHLTTSEEANAVYTDFVSEGIVGSVGNTSGVAPATGGFAVNAQGTPDTTVAISSGVAYVNGTPTSQNNQTFRINNSASTNLTISANSSGSTKYDWIYISLSAANLNNPNTAGDNVATIVASRSSSASTDDGTPPTYGYPLAVVTVANGFSTITNANIRDVRTQVALNTGTSNASSGWTALSTTTLTTATGYNKGNKEYDLTSSADLTSVLSPGMRLKVTRAVTPPTQCVDLEASSSQYASRASASVSGITFTDDYTLETWIKPESYSVGIIGGRFSTNGFFLRMDATGQIAITGYSGGVADFATSYQSVPLGQWTHVAATMDLSGATSTIYLNGVSVPLAYTNNAPTSITQAGDLAIGALGGGGTYFDGKISDFRIWSAVRTATQIRDNMNQQLVGNETNLVAYYKLNGDFNDSTSNANNLTAQGGAAATNSDNPMNSTEYAIITKITASTITVFTGTDYNIPNLTLSTPYYSTQAAPFGFSTDVGKWQVTSLYRAAVTQSSPVASTWYNPASAQLSVPVGAWNLSHQAYYAADKSSATVLTVSSTLSTASNTESDPDFTVSTQVQGATGTLEANVNAPRTKPVSVTAATPYYLNGMTSTASVFALYFRPTSRIVAECAYV